MSESIVYNMDCMEYMRTVPDKAFDLAVVDPPYGDGNGGSAKRFGGMFGAVYGVNTRAHVAEFGKKSWRGMLPQRRSIFKSFSASHANRLFGSETIFPCRRRDVF